MMRNVLVVCVLCAMLCGCAPRLPWQKTWQVKTTENTGCMDLLTVLQPEPDLFLFRVKNNLSAPATVVLRVTPRCYPPVQAETGQATIDPQTVGVIKIRFPRASKAVWESLHFDGGVE